MAMAMDAPSAEASDAPGFVFDESSGLYYDASSGFYYDAKAGWYYNTHNGQYYLYEDDAYVPLAATSSDETALQAVGDESNQGLIQNVGDLSNHEDEPRDEATTVRGILSTSGNSPVSTQTAGLGAEQEIAIHETSSQIVEDNIMEDAALVVSDSEMPDPSRRHVENVAEVLSEASSGLIPGTEMSLSMGPVPANIPDETFEATEREDSAGEPEETRPASVWIAETLTELYAQNTFETSADGEPEACVNPSSQQLYYQPNSGLEGAYEYAYMSGGYNEDSWREPEYHYRKQWGDSVAWDDHGTMDNELYESDDQSEELEEGEWRPDEEEKENYLEEGEILEDPIEELGGSGVNGEDYGTFSGEDPAHRGSSYTDKENYLHGVAESVGADYLHMAEGFMDMAGSDVDLSASVMAAEEQWQAQYLRKAKLKARSYNGSMELWDWSIIEQKKKVSKKNASIFRLIGRLAPNATQVHPSLRGSGGLIRTTPIREADREFVKVSSGRIYKLRRPSSKHLTAYSGYVSSNPTQDWGLPLINVDTEENYTDSSPGPIGATLNSSIGSVYGSNQLPASKKKNSKLKLKGVDGEPQPKYRDRAAERRTLHKGFGIGPGQKIVSVLELEKEEAEAATQMTAALEKAAAARPIGRDNIGKRMLEGMGWKEGQSLGSGEGGLVDPILALGNTGRTGLGWGSDRRDGLHWHIAYDDASSV